MNKCMLLGKIHVPKSISGKQNIIDNCKYICSLSETHRPIIAVLSNSGDAVCYGSTYDKSSDPSYAFFIFLSVGSYDVFNVECYNKVWDIYRLSGTTIL